jgi:hypothetical protein
MRILLCFCFLLCVCSCQSKRILTEPKIDSFCDGIDNTKLLTPHSFQRSSSHEKEYDFRKKVQSNLSLDKEYENYSFKDSIILKIKNDFAEQTFREIYNKKYILISHFINKGAAGPELMKRNKIFIISFKNLSVYEVILESSIQFTQHRCLLERAWQGSTTPIYAIDNITENTLVLLDTHLKYHLLDLVPYEGTLILDD